jgi:hypothetical protein
MLAVTPNAPVHRPAQAGEARRSGSGATGGSASPWPMTDGRIREASHTEPTKNQEHGAKAI